MHILIWFLVIELLTGAVFFYLFSRGRKGSIIAILAALLPLSASAQAPQIPLTGTVGPGGNFPFRNATPISMTSDANHTMVYPEGSGQFAKVTSTVSLTATRNLIEPILTNSQCFENVTTGGQSIQIIGASGTGVTIPNGTYACVQGDGTNYITSPQGAGTVTHTGSLTAGQLVIGNGGADTKVDTVAGTDGAGNMTVATLTANGPCSGGTAGCVKLPEGTVPTAAGGLDLIWGDSSTHRLKYNFNNAGAGFFVGIGTAGTSGHCPQFASNGIDLVDSGSVNCGGTPSPLTTKGDLYGFSSINARIPVGTNGQVLTADSTQALGLKWAAAGGGAVPTITIAPSDSPTPNASSATVVLTGTADQTAINTAIDTYCLASNTGGVVPGCTLNFLYGTVHLTGSIVVNRSDVNLQGLGFSSYGNVGAISNGGTKFLADNSTGAFPLFTVTTTTQCLGPGGVSDNRCRGITFQNLYIVCHDQTQRGIYDPNTTDNEKIENNTIQNCGTPIETGGDSVDIGGNNIQYNSSGVAAGNVHPNIHNNLIFDNNVSPSGADINCGPGCIVTANTLGNSGGSGATAEIIVGGDSTVTGNTIINPFGPAIAVNTNSYNVAITGNTITQNHASAFDWIVLAGCAGCTVTGNSGLVISGAQTGYYINLSPGVVNGVVNSVIANNGISGPFADPFDSFGVSGIYNFGTALQNSGNTIANNVASDSLSVPTSPATALSVESSFTNSIYANCYVSGANKPCGFSWQVVPGAAGMDQAQLQITGLEPLGSVKITAPSGALIGPAGNQVTVGDPGGNVLLGSVSSIFGGPLGEGYGVFSGGTASLYALHILDFDAGASGDHSVINRTAPHVWCFADGGAPTNCTGTINAAQMNAGAYESPASFVARSQTTATTTHTLLTTSATALYRINASAACDVVAAGSTYTLTVGWTDTSNTAVTQSVSGVDCGTLSAASNASMVLAENVKTGTAITVAVAIGGSPTYDVSATVEQLTSN